MYDLLLFHGNLYHQFELDYNVIEFKMIEIILFVCVKLLKPPKNGFHCNSFCILLTLMHDTQQQFFLLVAQENCKSWPEVYDT